ncbi:MAG: hypothetical protein GXO89_13000 [Chlorobi bacterium]|nr:hypothetical protein [Chlorobiota bacterium]
MIQRILLFTLVILGFSTLNSQEAKTISIGNQVWMSSNMDSIVVNSYCYVNDTNNCSKYGRLYNWETALIICPQGFHLPSDTEWAELIDTLGGPNVASQNLQKKESNGFNAVLAGNFNKGLDVFSFLDRNAYYWTSTAFNKKVAWFRQIGENQTNINRSTVDKEYFFSVRCLKDK